MTVATMLARLALAAILATGLAAPALAQANEPGCRPEMASLRLPIQRVNLAKDEVKLTFIGHATFLIETPGGVKAATDYNDYVRPSVTPDIATMNKAHSTHYSRAPDPAIKQVLPGWDPSGKGAAHHDVTLGDMRVRNVPTNIRTYSGGMIRRLEIAQATLHNPQVLFLDEPTIGLDPIARRTVWERLEQLRDKGTTILITTHDMEEADTLCDELAILHQGRLAVVGKPDALKAQVGEQASLDDVFVHFSGVGLEQDGNYRGTRDSRDAIQRLG